MIRSVWREFRQRGTFITPTMCSSPIWTLICRFFISRTWRCFRNGTMGNISLQFRSLIPRVWVWESGLPWIYQEITSSVSMLGMFCLYRIPRTIVMPSSYRTGPKLIKNSKSALKSIGPCPITSTMERESTWTWRLREFWRQKGLLSCW